MSFSRIAFGCCGGTCDLLRPLDHTFYASRPVKMCTLATIQEEIENEDGEWIYNEYETVIEGLLKVGVHARYSVNLDPPVLLVSEWRAIAIYHIGHSWDWDFPEDETRVLHKYVSTNREIKENSLDYYGFVDTSICPQTLDEFNDMKALGNQYDYYNGISWITTNEDTGFISFETTNTMKPLDGSHPDYVGWLYESRRPWTYWEDFIDDITPDNPIEDYWEIKTPVLSIGSDAEYQPINYQSLERMRFSKTIAEDFYDRVIPNGWVDPEDPPRLGGYGHHSANMILSGEEIITKKALPQYEWVANMLSANRDITQSLQHPDGNNITDFFEFSDSNVFTIKMFGELQDPAVDEPVYRFDIHTKFANTYFQYVEGDAYNSDRWGFRNLFVCDISGTNLVEETIVLGQTIYYLYSGGPKMGEPGWSSSTNGYEEDNETPLPAGAPRTREEVLEHGGMPPLWHGLALVMRESLIEIGFTGGGLRNINSFESFNPGYPVYKKLNENHEDMQTKYKIAITCSADGSAERQYALLGNWWVERISHGDECHTIEKNLDCPYARSCDLIPHYGAVAWDLKSISIPGADEAGNLSNVDVDAIIGTPIPEYPDSGGRRTSWSHIGCNTTISGSLYGNVGDDSMTIWHQSWEWTQSYDPAYVYIERTYATLYTVGCGMSILNSFCGGATWSGYAQAQGEGTIPCFWAQGFVNIVCPSGVGETYSPGHWDCLQVHGVWVDSGPQSCRQIRQIYCDNCNWDGNRAYGTSEGREFTNEIANMNLQIDMIPGWGTAAEDEGPRLRDQWWGRVKILNTMVLEYDGADTWSYICQDLISTHRWFPGYETAFPGDDPYERCALRNISRWMSTGEPHDYWIKIENYLNDGIWTPTEPLVETNVLHYVIPVATQRWTIDGWVPKIEIDFEIREDPDTSEPEKLGNKRVCYDVKIAVIDPNGQSHGEDGYIWQGVYNKRSSDETNDIGDLTPKLLSEDAHDPYTKITYRFEDHPDNPLDGPDLPAEFDPNGDWHVYIYATPRDPLPKFNEDGTINPWRVKADGIITSEYKLDVSIPEGYWRFHAGGIEFPEKTKTGPSNTAGQPSGGWYEGIDPADLDGVDRLEAELEISPGELDYCVRRMKVFATCGCSSWQGIQSAVIIPPGQTEGTSSLFLTQVTRNPATSSIWSTPEREGPDQDFEGDFDITDYNEGVWKIKIFAAQGGFGLHKMDIRSWKLVFPPIGSKPAKEGPYPTPDVDPDDELARRWVKCEEEVGVYTKLDLTHAMTRFHVVSLLDAPDGENWAFGNGGYLAPGSGDIESGDYSVDTKLGGRGPYIGYPVFGHESYIYMFHNCSGGGGEDPGEATTEPDHGPEEVECNHAPCEDFGLRPEEPNPGVGGHTYSPCGFYKDLVITPEYAIFQQLAGGTLQEACCGPTENIIPWVFEYHVAIPGEVWDEITPASEGPYGHVEAKQTVSVNVSSAFTINCNPIVVRGPWSGVDYYRGWWYHVWNPKYIPCWIDRGGPAPGHPGGATEFPEITFSGSEIKWGGHDHLRGFVLPRHIYLAKNIGVSFGDGVPYWGGKTPWGTECDVDEYADPGEVDYSYDIGTVKSVDLSYGTHKVDLNGLTFKIGKT